MKAITITQELQDLNPKIGLVGSVREMNIPKSFFSLTYNNGQRTDGYTFLDDSIHDVDGFKDIVKPVITEYQRLLPLIPADFANNVFTHRIEDFTQVEIDEQDAVKVKEEKIKAVKDVNTVIWINDTPDGTKTYAFVLGNDGKTKTIEIV